ncbi:MAG: FecR domain-containing protein [Treponema sp.]|nr:FecR domain-containing protein [Treponema sp.]
MKKMARLFTVLVIMIASAVPAFSGSAKVTYVKGKVEVNRNNQWVQLKVGDEVSETEMLSTGFQSEARINYNGSVMALAALTRITLSQLRSSGKKDYVDVYVDTGVIRSKVTHVDRDPPDYKTRTAVAVASVRGTDFITFGDGTNSVLEGAIVVEENTEGKKSYSQENNKEEDEEGSEDEESEEEGTAEGTESGGESDDKVAEESGNEDSGAEEPASDTGAETAGTDIAEAGTDGNLPESGAESDNSKDSGSDSNNTDNGPAKTTTPANQITQTPNNGAIVVGANQTSNFDSDGNFTSQLDNAKKNTTQSSDGVKTGAGNDTTQTDNTPVVKKGSLRINISLEN